MKNLLKSNFKRGLTSTCYIVAVCLEVAFALITLLLANVEKVDSMGEMAIDVMGNMSLFIPLGGVSIITRDYSYNTIRSKLVYGYSRVSIYFANLITVISLGLILYVLGIFMLTGIGGLIFGLDGIEAGKYFQVVGIHITEIIAIASFVTFVMMSFHGTSGIVFTYLGVFLSLILFSLLSEIINYQHKDIAEIVYQFLPDSQLGYLSITKDSGEDFGFNSDLINFYPLFNLIIIAFTTLPGVAMFKRSNIK